DRIDIDLDGVAKIAVDQHRALARNLHRCRNIMVELRWSLDDLHSTSAKDVGWPQEHRIADPLRDAQCLVTAARDAVRGLLEAKLLHQRRKTFAVFGKVDAIWRGSQDRHSRSLQLLGKLQRGLPAELDDHTEQLALFLLSPHHLKHILGGKRLEIEPVGGVGVGRDSLWVAVDHDRLKAGPVASQCERRMAAAIIELDPLPDPVGPATQDHHLPALGDVRLVVWLTKQWRLIGRIKVRSRCLELSSTTVDALEDRPDAKLQPVRADFLFSDSTRHPADCAVHDAAAGSSELAH